MPNLCFTPWLSLFLACACLLFTEIHAQGGEEIRCEELKCVACKEQNVISQCRRFCLAFCAEALIPDFLSLVIFDSPSKSRKREEETHWENSNSRQNSAASRAEKRQRATQPRRTFIDFFSREPVGRGPVEPPEGLFAEYPSARIFSSPTETRGDGFLASKLTNPTWDRADDHLTSARFVPNNERESPPLTKLPAVQLSLNRPNRVEDSSPGSSKERFTPDEYLSEISNSRSSPDSLSKISSRRLPQVHRVAKRVTLPPKLKRKYLPGTADEAQVQIPKGAVRKYPKLPDQTATLPPTAVRKFPSGAWSAVSAPPQNLQSASLKLTAIIPPNAVRKYPSLPRPSANIRQRQPSLGSGQSVQKEHVQTTIFDPAATREDYEGFDKYFGFDITTEPNFKMTFEPNDTPSSGAEALKSYPEANSVFPANKVLQQNIFSENSSEKLPVHPNEKFLQCCVQHPVIPQNCYTLCSFDQFNVENVVASTLFWGCPIAAAVPLLNCGSLGDDLRSCCVSKGVHEDCLSYCHPLGGFPSDHSPQCLKTVDPLRECFKENLLRQ